MEGNKLVRKKYVKIELALLVLLGISQYFGVTAANLGLVFIMICLFPLVPGQMQAEVLLIAMPFFNMFSYKLGSTSLFYLLMTLYCVQYLRRRRFQMGRNQFLIFFVCCLLTITMNNMEIWVKWALRFFLMVLFFNDEALSDSLQDTVQYTSVSAILSSAIGYIMQINGKSIYTRSYVYLQGVGSSTRFAGLIGDSVFYGQFIAVLIAANLMLAYQDKRYGRFAHIASAIMAAFALLSISKTAILLIAVELTGYVVLLIIRNAKNRKSVMKSVLLLIGVWAALVLLYWYVMTHSDNFLVRSFMTRFAANDLWTGRTSIAETYLKWIASDWKCWLVGMRYSTYTRGIQSGNLVIRRAHNILIETACLFGVIPTIAILVALVCYFCRLQSRYHVSVMAYLPLMILLASGVSLHGHFEWHYYFLCSIAFACVHFNIRKRKEQLSHENNAIC